MQQAKPTKSCMHIVDKLIKIGICDFLGVKVFFFFLKTAPASRLKVSSLAISRLAT